MIGRNDFKHLGVLPSVAANMSLYREQSLQSALERKLLLTRRGTAAIRRQFRILIIGIPSPSVDVGYAFLKMMA